MGKKQAPNSDELELSLFGPGLGECVVLHLGSGKWMIVDSCWDARANRPVALRYLEEIDVDVASQVRLVVVSHWHDDHIRGAASVLKAADSAEFVCSAALRNPEFLTLLEATQEGVKLVEHSSSTSEFTSILATLEARRERPGPHRWAAEGMVLFHDEPSRVEVRALSPSGATITDSSSAFVNLLPREGEPIRRIPDDSPNAHSVVLMVTSPASSILLGGDLETGRDPTRGWHAIVSSSVRPQTRSVGFKVPHHGSDNGDLKGIWSYLLQPSPYAMVTPYVRGRKPLPSVADVSRLTLQTSNAFCTAWPPTVKPKTENKAAAKTMDEVAKNRRAIRQVPGHIRLRVPICADSPAAIELFDGARKL
jgi:hypothetical protein